MRSCIFILLMLLLPLTASGQEAQDNKFTDFINRDTDGSWFDQAILLSNKCDFSKCGTKECAYQLFNDTIFKQECEYVSSEYGVRGKDWEISGESAVDVNIFSNQRYYDDLGIDIFSTSKEIVLHFEVTSSVNTLKDFEYEKFGQSDF